MSFFFNKCFLRFFPNECFFFSRSGESLPCLNSRYAAMACVSAYVGCVRAWRYRVGNGALLTATTREPNLGASVPLNRRLRR